MSCTWPESAEVLNSALVSKKKCLNCKDFERTDHGPFQEFLSTIINLYFVITHHLHEGFHENHKKISSQDNQHSSQESHSRPPKYEAQVLSITP
jgi:hypothetical protein